MANPRHIKIIKNGPAAVRSWRRQNPGSGFDLVEANLRRLRPMGDSKFTEIDEGVARHLGMDLRYSNLTKAILDESRLAGADLRNCTFRGASLVDTDLRGALLRGADLVGANLCGANLSGADLRFVTFSDYRGRASNLAGAVLTKARFTRRGGQRPDAGFLELAAAHGLPEADFGNPKFLEDYLADAFDYVHSVGTPERAEYPDFVTAVAHRIESLVGLYSEDEPPGKEILDLVSGISEELLSDIRKNPHHLFQISPRKFEELVAWILARFGWDVELTAKTKDGGYDVFAVSKDISGLTTSWIIECKRYAKNRKVGVEVARALYAVKSDMRVSNAMLATTSAFTAGVREFKSSRYDFALRDYEGILEWINVYRPNPEGRILIKNHRIIVPGRE